MGRAEDLGVEHIFEENIVRVHGPARDDELPVDPGRRLADELEFGGRRSRCLLSLGLYSRGHLEISVFLHLRPSSSSAKPQPRPREF